jgi:hypothetical protein
LKQKQSNSKWNENKISLSLSLSLSPHAHHVRNAPILGLQRLHDFQAVLKEEDESVVSGWLRKEMLLQKVQ